MIVSIALAHLYLEEDTSCALLEGEFVQNGMMTKEQFLAGYGLTQAVPGPLFTFASYIGAVLNGTLGATLATIAIFLPAFLLVIGVLPFWNSVRKISFIQGALLGVNAAVVGILIAAFTILFGRVQL